MAKTALISGLSGQDGSYLADLLLGKGYRIFGLLRKPDEWGSAEHLQGEVEVSAIDLDCRKSWWQLLDATAPDEIYHLAGLSYVPDSWDDPSQTLKINTHPVCHLLRWMVETRSSARLFFASSSEVFGYQASGWQNERSSLCPSNPYAISKAAAQQMIQAYRQRDGLFACSGILFNHESPRRPLHFVTRKISHAAAAIRLGLKDHVVLGNLDAGRDWGSAKDFVDCFWRSLQAHQPDDYVIGTGQISTVRNLLDIAFGHVGLDWQAYVQQDPRLLRPLESRPMQADSSKAQTQLGWKLSQSVQQWLCDMVDHDLRLLQTTDHRS